MLNVNSKIRLNRPRIARIEAGQIRALEMAAEALHTDIIQRQIMPRDTGNLQNESTFVYDSLLQKGQVSLIHSTPYARRLYYHPEYNFSNVENPNAGGKWLDDYLEGGKEENFVPNAYREFFKRYGGV